MRLILLSLLILFFATVGLADEPPKQALGEPDSLTEQRADIDHLLAALTGDQSTATVALQRLRERWQPGFAAMLLESAYLTRPVFAGELLQLLSEQTGEDFGYDLNAWYQWLWSRPAQDHPLYAEFKSRVYRLLDERFGAYFSPERSAKIRLDEVRWGGVRQDGIPPLREPQMVAANSEESRYLDDDNIVFGVNINGDARAYPKRILAWHEMFTDIVGGVPIAGVYCTLCGTVIPFTTTVDGVAHRFGTSGFLYRSNKLMYDQATQTLWNTLWGTPVIGPLANRDIQLPRSPVVTTTWGEWRRRHPHTTVLSLDTGHHRDYDEGAAYREYFATDKLMFTVPQTDKRLKNKDQVLALLFAQAPEQPLAIATDYLRRRPIYHDSVAGIRFVVLTDDSGASRVYSTSLTTDAGVDIKITRWDGDRTAGDADGNVWTLSEDALSDGQRRLPRLPAHRAFWFGWYAAYTHTRLVH